jgi:hypothetical protein
MRNLIHKKRAGTNKRIVTDIKTLGWSIDGNPQVAKPKSIVIIYDETLWNGALEKNSRYNFRMGAED